MSTAVIKIPSQGHKYPDHPENPDRFNELFNLNRQSYSSDLTWLNGSPADSNLIASIHTQEMIDHIEQTCQQGSAIIDHAPTYVSHSSFNDAKMAAGAVISCTQSILNKETSNAFAIIRPPGHHAEPDSAMGFCIFNNAAIAAQFALQQGQDRVLIFDFDAHHGNGTQAAFMQEERAAYISTHQEGIYPGTGRFNEAPNARGRIVNIPLPIYSGDLAFLAIIKEIVSPLIQNFQPGMILVSAGFDSHWQDPLTNLGLSINGFFSMAEKLVELADQHCDGKIIFILEGGYLPRIVSSGIDACLHALTRTPFIPANDTSPYPEPDIKDRISTICSYHQI
ncbi:histone deacetylase [Chloroflexota bacterium]